MPGYREFLSINRQNVNNSDLLKKIRRSTNHKRILRTEILLRKERDKKLNGEWGYQIEFPIVDWEGDGIAIGIHCDAGGILEKRAVGAK